MRAKPASSIMKPACMKNTRNAAARTQAVLTPLIVLVTELDRASASTCDTLAAPAMCPITHGASWVMIRKNSASPISLPARNVTKNF